MADTRESQFRKLHFCHGLLGDGGGLACPSFSRLEGPASILRIALATTIGLVLYVQFFEHRLIYFPEPGLGASPRSDHEDINFETGDGVRLHGWLIGADSPNVLVLSHGNGGNIGYRPRWAIF